MSPRCFEGTALLWDQIHSSPLPMVTAIGGTRAGGESWGWLEALAVGSRSRSVPQLVGELQTHGGHLLSLIPLSSPS